MTGREKICAVVPAAGLSSRMGEFKPLLSLRGRTVIENCVESALSGGADTVTVVTGYRAEEVESVLSESFGDRVSFVRNTDYADSDMLRSVKAGIRALGRCDAFFILPGDMPLIAERTFEKLLEERKSSSETVLIPVLDGAQTHPPLIDSKIIPQILSYDGQDGLRGMWKHYENCIKLVPVEDRGTGIDIDTPEDYMEAGRFTQEQKDMETEKKHKISKSVVKKDHSEKMSGRSIYVADYPSDGVLCGKMLRSKLAHAKVLGVDVPELPDGYYYVDARDIPGLNSVQLHGDETPVFCRETVEYIGEAIAMICGPDEKTVKALVDQCRVNYEELEPVTDIRKATEVLAELKSGYGDVDAAFAEADRIYDEEFRTGYQEQVYLETQGMMAEPEEDGRMYIHGSIQDLFYVHNAVKRVLGCGDEGLHVFQDSVGGGFGGKEDYPSILACEVAVAAHKTQKPVRCVLERREDMECTPKRHPSLTRYRAAVKDGRITAMDIDIIIDGGAYFTLSRLVLERCVFESMGVYSVPNVRVNGRALKTNTTPSGAFRGFGGPQVIFAAEMMMDHIARDLGRDEVEFKKDHLAKQGDLTVTKGMYHFHVPLPEMIEETDKACGYRRKKEEYSRPQTGRYRRGIGMSLSYHGMGLGGVAEREVFKAVVRLHKYADGRVEILASSDEIGQGVRTTFSKIVAEELGMPLEKVFYDLPDSGRVADSGLTAGSRSIMVVGKLLQRAAARLKEQWIDGEEQEVEEHFKEPEYMISYDPVKEEGDAYLNYGWGVTVIELELDTCTGITKILNAFGCFDIGVPIDYNIVIGQLEGGMMQGIGFAFMERMKYDGRGYIRNNNLGDYLIPSSKDVPNLKVMLHVQEYPYGPFGANGLGELPLVGGPCAYLDAVEQALGGAELSNAPFTLEDMVEVLKKEETRND